MEPEGIVQTTELIAGCLEVTLTRGSTGGVWGEGRLVRTVPFTLDVWLHSRELVSEVIAEAHVCVFCQGGLENVELWESLGGRVHSDLETNHNSGSPGLLAYLYISWM